MLLLHGLRCYISARNPPSSPIVIKLDLPGDTAGSDKATACHLYSLTLPWSLLQTGIRSHPLIKGIQIGDMESRVGLYADDTLLYLADPVVSVPSLLDFIEFFGKLSGDTMNWGKSEFITLTDSLDQDFLHTLPFTIAKDDFTYLGLRISHDPKHLFKLNYAGAISKLKLNIEKWRIHGRAY